MLSRINFQALIGYLWKENFLWLIRLFGLWFYATPVQPILFEFLLSSSAFFIHHSQNIFRFFRYQNHLFQFFTLRLIHLNVVTCSLRWTTYETIMLDNRTIFHRYFRKNNPMKFLCWWYGLVWYCKWWGKLALRWKFRNCRMIRQA